jgi:drug/metabolite transporter (DMT)-like permease
MGHDGSLRANAVGSVGVMTEPVARTEEARRTAGILAVSLTTVVWGMAPLILKQMQMPVLTFAAYRLWAGVLIFAAMFAVTGRRLTWVTLRTCALGGVIFTADVACSFLAFRLTSVADATIIGALAPICIMIGAGRWFGERVGRRELVFVGISLGGVALVAIGSAGTPAFDVWGDLFAVASVFTWTTYWLVSKRARASVGALEYMASVILVAAVLMTLLALVSGEGLSPPSRAMDWLWIWVVALGAGAIGHVLLAWSHRHVEAWLGSLITQCMPVVSSVAAWVLLGESLTPLTIVGGLIVLAATAAILVRSRARGADDNTFEAPEMPAPAG